MKKILIVPVLLLASWMVSAQGKVINDANAQERKLNGSFTSIKVSKAVDLYISQGEAESIAVSAATVEMRDRIKTEVENGELKIWFDAEENWWKNNGNRKLKAYISFKTLQKLTASGASDIYVDGEIKANDLELNLSGASDFKGGSIVANELIVNIRGASDATIKGGKVSTLKVDASGASDFKGFDLVADNCSAEASGASDIKVTVNNELNVRASGASGVQYKGSGRIRDLKTSGASGVNRKS